MENQIGFGWGQSLTPESMISLVGIIHCWYLLICRFDQCEFIAYACGQREIGESGYEHWQFVIHCRKPCRLSALKKAFGDHFHWEPTRSAAAEAYCVKKETSVPDTQFECGRKPIRRGESQDWDTIKRLAISGQLDSIPSDVFVRNYNALKRISADYMEPVGVEREVYVYWGITGSGKSRRAWSEAGLEAYPKDPRSKFWDGYRGQENVVIDEFRGGIDISHILRWLDRYPCVVEIKGSSTVLKAKTIWITSNLNPRDWYPNLDEDTLKALLRRLKIIHFPEIKSGL